MVSSGQSDFKTRLRDELRELCDRYNKLGDFLLTKPFYALPEDERREDTTP